MLVAPSIYRGADRIARIIGTELMVELERRQSRPAQNYTYAAGVASSWAN
jgi:hypothetical protein